MAVVVMCGQPCSGKSTAASSLLRALEASELQFSLKLIDEPSLGLDRDHSYRDMPNEKNLRGVLRSAVDRAVSKDSIVIVDSLNNIKGYRYELWCLARAAGTRFCVLYCDTDVDECREWNKIRAEKSELGYCDRIFEDLARRFERPDRRNRWDSPLFELRPSEGRFDESFPAIVEAIEFVKGEKQSSRSLQPTIATQKARTADTNTLYELDRATQEVINALMEAQTQGIDAITVSLGEGLPTMSLQRSVGLPELRRHRRTFIKLAAHSSLSGPPPPRDAVSAKRMFADYLNRELKAA